MKRFSERLRRLEADKPPNDWEGKLFAVVRGPLAEAESLPARLGLVGAEPWPVVVTEDGWDGGEPSVVSPLANLDGATDEGLRILGAFRCNLDGGVTLTPNTTVVQCVVEAQHG